MLSFAEAPAHAQAVARQAFVNVDGVVQPAAAPRFGRTPAAPPRAAPQPGEHTAQVLEEAGLSAAEVQALFDHGEAR